MIYVYLAIVGELVWITGQNYIIFDRITLESVFASIYKTLVVYQFPG